jgi:integrase
VTAPRLLDQVRAAIRARHYSRRTEAAYVHWIRRYIVFHGRRHPNELAAADVTAFVTWLAVNEGVAASTQNQALSGVLFLYREVLRLPIGAVEMPPRARLPSRVPVVLTPVEVRAVLDALDGVPKLVAMLLYGSGLRLQECLALRVKDLDFERCEITVRRSKGQKDRRVMLPNTLRPLLLAQLDAVRSSTRPTWRPALAGSSCRMRSSASFRGLRQSGFGSSCSRLAVSAGTRALGHPRDFTCTSR